MAAEADTHAALAGLDGRGFESYIAALFERLGYAVEQTEYFDYGADLVVVRDGERLAVQAKGWKRPVGAEAVRQVVAALPVYDCGRGLVVSASTFTARAVRLAAANGVELWDGARLAAQARPERRGRGGPRCAACDRRVSPNVASYCKRNAERFGGRLYCFEHQRSLVGVLR